MNIKEIDGVKYITLAEHNKMLLTAIKLEREACATICDDEAGWGEINPAMGVAARNCADFIRNRGE